MKTCDICGKGHEGNFLFLGEVLNYKPCAECFANLLLQTKGVARTCSQVPHNRAKPQKSTSH